MKILKIENTSKATVEGNTVIVQDVDYFCINCGHSGLLVEEGDGDYYMGPAFYCMSCRHKFFIVGHSDDYYVKSMVLTEKQEKINDK